MFLRLLLILAAFLNLGSVGQVGRVLEGKTGLFFDEQTAESVIACMDEFEKREGEFTDRSVYTAHVQKFSKEEFDKKVLNAVEERVRI